MQRLGLVLFCLLLAACPAGGGSDQSIASGADGAGHVEAGGSFAADFAGGTAVADFSSTEPGDLPPSPPTDDAAVPSDDLADDASSAEPGDLLAPAPPDLAGAGPQTLSYTLTPFTLQGGEEKIVCQYIPPDGQEHWINQVTVDLNPGSHHLVIYRIIDKVGMPPSDPYPCSQLDVPAGFDGMLPGAQQLHTDYAFPPGVAMKMEAHHGLLFQEHYINASLKPITSAATWKANVIDRSQVAQMAGMLFYSNFGLKLPPMQTSQATQTCHAPYTMELVTTLGHMHQHGLSFDATAGGSSIYHTDSWDAPNNMVFASPGFAIKAGDPITWTCTYNNDTNATLKFGNSAVANEMCIFVGFFYPSPTGGTEFFCN